jgi:hypothetical protein
MSSDVSTTPALATSAGTSSPVPSFAALVDKSVPVETRALLLRGCVTEPNRSAILLQGVASSTDAVDGAHIARIVWVLNTCSRLCPTLAPVVSGLKTSTVAEANTSLSQVNNLSFDTAELVSVVRCYLTWVLQLTQDLHDLGIRPHETPGILSVFAQVRRLNRGFAEKMASKAYRDSLSPNNWRAAVTEHQTAVAAVHTPLTSVIALTLADISINVLCEHLPSGSSPLDPAARKAALMSLKASLIPTARVARSTATFDLKSRTTSGA